jgi:excisionase family DNA binding protein
VIPIKLHDHRPQSAPDQQAEPAVRLLLTAKEAAAALAISERSLWTLTDSGAVRSVRLGRSVRYALADLQSYIDSLRQVPPS